MNIKKYCATGTVIAAFAATAASAENFEFWYGPGWLDTPIQAQCEAFNAAQSDHVVTCIGQGSYDAGMQKAIAAYRSNEHPVLIQFFDAGTLDVMLSDAIIPVADLMPDVDWSDYISGAQSYYAASDGRLFAQPYNGSTLVFYANMDQLGDVGITEIPTTWEDVVRVSRLLKDNGHTCPFATDASPWRVLEQLAARHGEAIATNNNGYSGMDATYTFNQGLVATHMQNLFDWREEGLVRLNEDTEAGKYTAAFNAGECAMMEGSTGSYKSAFTALGDTVALGLAPMYEGYERSNTFIGGASIWVMQGRPDSEVEAAKAFLDFVRQDDQQITFAGMTGYMPMTNSAFDALVDSGQSNELEFATVELGVSSLNQPGSDDSRGIRLGFFTQLRGSFTEEIQKAFNGDQTMQAALDNAVAAGNEQLERFAATYDGVELP